MTQTVTITAKRAPSDDVALVVDGLEWSGWQSVRITRSMERCPNDFDLEVTEQFPGRAEAMVFKPGAPCEVWIGKDRVITGYLNRYMPSISAGQHTVRISGRGKCQDLVDCAAEWPGNQIMASSVLEVARKLAKPYGIEVRGDPGPAVGQGGKTAVIPQLNLMLGETAWEVIERLCRIAGLLAYEMPDGNLLLTVDPGNEAERELRNMGGDRSEAASGFTEGVNVESAQAVFADDQRFSHYQAYRLSFDRYTDINDSGNFIAERTDPGVMRRRLRVIVAEMGHNLAEQNAADRAGWEAARRWGRGHMVTVTTDGWRDSSGALYRPNSSVFLELPTLQVDGVAWIVSDVTYRKGQGGTHCDLMLMPPQAFQVQPTLPPQVMPDDVARLPNAPGR